MNNILERLIGILSSTKLYSLNENSLIYAELSAYAQAIYKVRQQIDKLIPSIFIQEMDEECLNHWEKLFNISIPYEKDDEMYYEILKARFYSNDGEWSYRNLDFLYYVYQLFNLNIEMDYADSALILQLYDGNSIFDYDKASEMIEKIVPAYIRYYADVEPPDFSELEAFDYSFEQLDNYNLPWGIIKD